MVDYSRFDHIGESDEEESPPLRRPSAAAPVSRPAGPPPNVMEDLEDYFRRIEERQQARDEAMMASDGPPSVERLTAEQIEGLNRVKYEPFDASYAECSVCLEDFAASDDLIEMPCAAGHLFHKSCASEVLSRSVFCPLCRVDVREIVTATPESPVAEQRAAEQEPAEQVTPLSPRQLGYTRDGGMIMRYEPNPPQEVPRPAYIPAAQRGSASFVEISYPERGVARIWRVPRPSEDTED